MPKHAPAAKTSPPFLKTKSWVNPSVDLAKVGLTARINPRGDWIWAIQSDPRRTTLMTHGSSLSAPTKV